MKQQIIDMKEDLIKLFIKLVLKVMIFLMSNLLSGFEGTSDSAAYFISGIYLDDNAGILFTGESSNFLVTPSFGFGIYDDGNGKKLGNSIEFRTTLELSYQFKNKNRIGLSFGHISNANLGDKNPGVEILSLSYQIPY